MDSNNKKELDDMEVDYEEYEDITKYGEFVSSYFAWITLEQQKKRTEEMENMGK